MYFAKTRGLLNKLLNVICGVIVYVIYFGTFLFAYTCLAYLLGAPGWFIIGSNILLLWIIFQMCK